MTSLPPRITLTDTLFPHTTFFRSPTSMLDILFQDATAHSWSVPDALKAIVASPAGLLIMLNCQGSAELLFDQFGAWNQQPATQAAAPDRESRYGLRTDRKSTRLNSSH